MADRGDFPKSCTQWLQRSIFVINLKNSIKSTEEFFKNNRNRFVGMGRDFGQNTIKLNPFNSNKIACLIKLSWAIKYDLHLQTAHVTPLEFEQSKFMLDLTNVILSNVVQEKMDFAEYQCSWIEEGSRAGQRPASTSLGLTSLLWAINLSWETKPFNLRVYWHSLNHRQIHKIW